MVSMEDDKGGGQDAAGLRRARGWDHLLRHAVKTPDRVALLHKHRGRWLAYRWGDVLGLVRQRAALLRGLGFGPGARLALCAPYGPESLAVAFAAEAEGGHVHPLAPELDGDALVQAVDALGPVHAFVHARRVATRWLAAPVAAPSVLLTPHAPQDPAGRWQVVGWDGAGAAVVTAPGIVWRPGGAGLAWVEEDTDWSQGWAVLSRTWAARGWVLAVPETPETAGRDRAELCPDRLLCSAPRWRELAGELGRRLPPPGTVTRGLADWVLARPDGLAGRLLRRRLDRLTGLAGLRQSLAPINPDPVWVW